MSRSDRVRPTTLALDLEGTLISNAISVFPRPGLRTFLDWVEGEFERIVVFSAVTPARVVAVLRLLADEDSVPNWVADVEVFQPAGSCKDLHDVDADIGRVLLVDDQESYVCPDQLDRWVPIREWEPPYSPDDVALAELIETLGALL